MSDESGGPNEAVVCPACDSVRIERIRPADSAFRCQNCGSEFDAEGGPIVVE